MRNPQDFFEKATAQTIKDRLSDENINNRDDDGMVPLHWAAACSSKPAVIAALVEAGAEIGSQDN